MGTSFIFNIFISWITECEHFQSLSCFYSVMGFLKVSFQIVFDGKLLIQINPRLASDHVSDFFGIMINSWISFPLPPDSQTFFPQRKSMMILYTFNMGVKLYVYIDIIATSIGSRRQSTFQRLKQ